jgi:peptide/nickel transport system substrate-binding protein
VTAVRTRWLAGTVVLLVVAVGVAWAMLWSGSSRPASDGREATAMQDGGTVRFGTIGEPSGFNINTAKDNDTAVQNVVANVYPAVFRTHPDLSVRLDRDVMESAELTDERPQTVTYRIRREAVWSDGVPISAADFTYLWRHSRGADERIDVASTTGYRDIRSVTGLADGKTVTVVFARPFADWRSLFFNLLPSHHVEQQAGGWNTGLDRNPQQIPSGGPFRIADHTRGESLTLERNPRWWGPRAHLDRIVVRFLPDSAVQADALRNGEVDVIYPRPQLDVVRTIQSLPGVGSQLRFGLSFEDLTFNLNHPVLAELAVRQAIALAIDSQQLLERTIGQVSGSAQVLGNRIWLTGQPAYQDHLGPYGRGDVAAAADLLKQAGWTRGADGSWAKGSRQLRLRFSTMTEDPLRLQLGLLLQDQLKRAGITLEIHNVPAEKLFGDRLPNGNFDLIEFAWIGNPFAISANRDLYTTNSALNYGGFSDPEVDRLFEQATAELDPTRSATLANQIDRKLWEGLPSIPLFQRPTFIAWRDTLRNVAENPSLEGPLWNAEAWGYAKQ